MLKKEIDINEEWEIIKMSVHNPSNFSVIYEKYYEQIFRFVYARLDEKDLAHDIANQTFLKALQNLSSYENRGIPFSSWLYRIAFNELSSFFRKKKNFRTINIDSVSAVQIAGEINEDDSEQSSKLQKLTTALQFLSQDELFIVEMRFFEKRAFKEIGEILSITENNAKVKLYRILDKMRSLILNNKKLS